jgi:hypothetical protein
MLAQGFWGEVTKGTTFCAPDSLRFDVPIRPKSRPVAAPKVMHITLDYDGTYTLKPAAWDDAIEVLIAGGFCVSIVTARDDRHDNNADLQRLAAQGLAVHFTRDFTKKAWLERENTDPVAIWIDENQSPSRRSATDWDVNDASTTGGERCRRRYEQAQ